VDRTTQLPNREFFRKELTRAIRRAVRQKVTGALLFVDLDGFKRVNDTHGHDAGDMILSQFSERLANVLRAEDLIAFKAMNAMETEAGDSEKANKNKQMLARLGGDEFTVLLSEIREATDAATVSQRIIDAVSLPFDVNGTKVNIGASVGIAIFPKDGSDYQTILKSADMAMYQAKEEGKNTYRYFSEELNQEAARRMEIEQDLRVALENNNELELYYQPKIHCGTALPKSAEALIRWKHPEKGMIQPLDFINVAEDCGLILPLGRWILLQACQQLKKFEDAGIDISIAVNISTAQFERPDLSNIVIEVLEETGANPANLELELTESMAMQNPDIALNHINILKKLGVRFAIDDFGTGYSNLSQLSRLPFDVFKIDRSFVDKLTNRDDEHGRVIVKTILGMANSLNYETVAEGVETISQLEFLTEYGCTYAQGYYFARPMPSQEFTQWYTAWKKQDKSVMAAMMRQGAAA
jgi:predicted signal transduction protein with EAL and GGDEF domain